MNEALLKELREKILKDLTLQTKGPILSDLFSLIEDLNFLLFCLLRELGKLSSGGYLSPEILAALLKIESNDDKKIITLGRELLRHSKAELLQGVAALPHYRPVYDLGSLMSKRWCDCRHPSSNKS